MRWFLCAIRGGHIVEKPILDHREDVLDFIERKAPGSRVAIDIPTMIEHDIDMGDDELWCTAVSVPDDWEAEYDAGWMLSPEKYDENINVMVFAHPGGKHGKAWTITLVVRTPVGSNGWSQEATVFDPKKSYSTPLKAVVACKKMHARALKSLPKLGEKILNMFEKSMASIIREDERS